MKNLFLAVCFLFMIAPAFAENVFCPQSITCTNQGCKEIPDNFYISSGNPASHMTYYFRSAHSTIKHSTYNVCTYLSRIPGTNTIALKAKESLQANRSYPGNQWVLNGVNTICMAEDYVSSIDANKCPFKRI